jgi:hypothetical protein
VVRRLRRWQAYIALLTCGSRLSLSLRRPFALKNFAAYSLKRLGVDHIDIYRLARLDPLPRIDVPQYRLRAP